jgi:hypothetical protein
MRSSLQAIPRVCERSPGTAVVILTMQDDPSFARQAPRSRRSRRDGDHAAIGALVGTIA